MNALIVAAGLGTRLRPLTDTMPKALVPVAGRPMLEHQILKLKAAGFDHIVINVHHFGEQIIDYVKANDFGLRIDISDERSLLLDTGGAVRQASRFFTDGLPVLIHNVDIFPMPTWTLSIGSISPAVPTLRCSSASGRHPAIFILTNPSVCVAGRTSLLVPSRALSPMCESTFPPL